MKAIMLHYQELHNQDGVLLWFQLGLKDLGVYILLLSHLGTISNQDFNSH
jgi:hypothetical protein